MREARQRAPPWEKAEREVRNMAENRKEAAERLRQLANSDFKNDEVEISVSYDSSSSRDGKTVRAKSITSISDSEKE